MRRGATEAFHRTSDDGLRDDDDQSPCHGGGSRTAPRFGISCFYLPRRFVMPSYYIHMDQGIAADLRHFALCSGQFSNCAPIVMYNAGRHEAALYHLAGCKQLDQLKIGHINALITVVGPTVAYVLQGTEDVVFGAATGHVDPVTALFRHARIPVLHDFNGRSCFSSITVSEVGGNLDIAVGVDMTHKLDTREAIDALPADIAFIGEDRNEKLSIWH
jgi:hypothetical protein